ncbi:MAG: hypothetical protein LBN92_00445, partial [Treponema sp.]|nr:hypothetical protein [Treponema sp.]
MKSAINFPDSPRCCQAVFFTSSRASFNSGLVDAPAMMPSGYIQVGMGWTGNSTKTNTRCNTSTGSMKALDSGYPALKAA